MLLNFASNKSSFSFPKLHTKKGDLFLIIPTDSKQLYTETNVKYDKIATWLLKEFIKSVSIDLRSNLQENFKA